MLQRGLVALAAFLLIGSAGATAQVISLPCPKPAAVEAPCPDRVLPPLTPPLFVASARVAPQIDWRTAPNDRARIEFSADPTFSSRPIIHSTWSTEGFLQPDPSLWRRISRTAGEDHTIYVRAVYQIEGGKQLVAPAVRLHLTR